MTAIYVILRGDTDWTLLYYGNDHRKAHKVEDWAEIHCMKVNRVRILNSDTCFMNDQFFRSEKKNRLLSMMGWN